MHFLCEYPFVVLDLEIWVTNLKQARGGSRAAVTPKTECFVITVNGFQPLIIITKHSILDIAAALDMPLTGFTSEKFSWCKTFHGACWTWYCLLLIFKFSSYKTSGLESTLELNLVRISVGCSTYNDTICICHASSSKGYGYLEQEQLAPESRIIWWLK